MKYAMIPINRRYNDKNERVVRRILISYKTKNKNGIYEKCSVIAKDPYFLDKNSSHQYQFDNDSFYLIKDIYEGKENFLLGVRRPYQFNEGYLAETAIEFTSRNILEAIKRFNDREEIH